MLNKLYILGSFFMISSAIHCSQVVVQKTTSLPVAEVVEAMFKRNCNLSVTVDKKSDSDTEVQPTIFLPRHTRKKAAFVFDASAVAQQSAGRSEVLSGEKNQGKNVLPVIKVSKPQTGNTSPQQRVVKLPSIGNEVLTAMGVHQRTRRASEAEEQKNEQKDEERFSDDSHHASPDSEGVSLLVKVVTLDDENLLVDSDKNAAKS